MPEAATMCTAEAWSSLGVQPEAPPNQSTEAPPNQSTQSYFGAYLGPEKEMLCRSLRLLWRPRERDLFSECGDSREH